MTYTYDDVITAKDILTGKVKKEDIIGKKGWFMNAVPSDMSLNIIMRIAQNGRLESVEDDLSYIFRCGDYGFIYFLPEKEDKPEYLPFDLSKPEDREALRDKWIRNKQTGNEAKITCFKHTREHDWQAHIPQTGLRSGFELLANYEFLDGSAIGRQMASK